MFKNYFFSQQFFIRDLDYKKRFGKVYG